MEQWEKFNPQYQTWLDTSIKCWTIKTETKNEALNVLNKAADIHEE